jgi:hypothetical protein
MTGPEVTPQMRAAARANPSSWLYVIDPALDPDREVPPWGMVGAYPVNQNGEIGEHFRHNPGYRPVAHPRAGRPAPPPGAPGLERLLELVLAGERDQAALLPAVLEARLLLYAAGPRDTRVTGFLSGRLGVVAVPACTAPAHVPRVWPGWREIRGRDLATLLYGHPLVLNPGGPVTAMIPAGHLSDAAAIRL